MKPSAKGTQGSKEPLNLSQARQMLSPLVRQVAGAPRTAVPIAVRGKVRAYLISAERLEQLEAREREIQYGLQARPRLRGSVKVLGDLALGSQDASAELEAAALRRAARVLGGPPATRRSRKSRSRA